MKTYGIVNSEGMHIDVSKSEKGAKQYATIHGYTQVSVRYNCGYQVDIIAVKVNKKWINYTTLQPH